MSTPPATPTFPPYPTLFGFTKLLEDIELKRSSDCALYEDEIEDFTQTQHNIVPVEQCCKPQVSVLLVFDVFGLGLFVS